MNREARNQYMETLRERYLQASKKEKGNILDEYCKNTGQERKYVIKKFRYKAKLKDTQLQRKPRKEKYDGLVKASLAKIWKIFDYPCGQRLQPILKEEINRLYIFGEVICSDVVVTKLKTISASEIDRSLKHEKEVLRLKNAYVKKHSTFLCSKVPTKTSSEMKRDTPGRLQVDCVEHCGMSASGEYVNSLSIVDVFSGWWEGDAMMGKGQERALTAIDGVRIRSPFPWIEIHPDNGGNIMNYAVYTYAEKQGIEFSRSRPYKKNDNCFVEQKNSTHVRKVFGYLRYDTEEEQLILSDLYRNELRLYKNFFQPVMKLVEKTRVNGKIKKKYDIPKTPYRRLMESSVLTKKQKEELHATYERLNPAELKRKIDAKLTKLYNVYKKKNGLPLVEGSRITSKKIVPSIVSYYMTQP
jgi:hypothetical protein